MSEKVFSSIFDFFDMKVYTRVGVNDTVILPDGMKESSSKALCTIEYQTVGNNTTTLVKIPEKYLEGVSEVQYVIDGKTATHTLMLGEKTSKGIVFTETSIWGGNFSHTAGALKVGGLVDHNDIKVTCITPTDSFIPVFEIITVKFNPVKINPGIFLLIGIIILGIIEIRFIFRHRA